MPKKSIDWNPYIALIVLVLSYALFMELSGAGDLRERNRLRMSDPDRISRTRKSQPASSHLQSSEQKKPSLGNSSYSFRGFGYDGKEIFASSIIAYAGVPAENEDNEGVPSDAATCYGEGINQVGVALSGARKGDRFQVTITADKFIRPSKFDFVVEESEAFIEVAPNIIFDYATLSRLRQTTPFNITFAVQRGGEPPKTFTETWMAHQINDCQTSTANLYLAKDGNIKAKHQDTSWSFAGFVNENHPWIDTVLRDALATKLCSSFTGYQRGEKNVLPQVKAIWTALHLRRIKYSSIATTTVSASNRYQHVRFLDETIDAAQANCVDGSAILASALRKINLNVSIILVPGHAYVAVLDEPGDTFLFGIETTMLGRGDLDKAIEYATETGPQSLSKILDKLTDESDMRYQEINIKDARKLGIQPIPFTR